MFQFQGLIIGSVEANYFTPAQQQLIHDFVDRRGGGLLFLGGRATLSDGGYPSSPLAELVPTKLPEGKGTFHRDFTGQELTPEGARSIICRLDDDPARNLEKWKKMPQMANYQEVGEEKPGATVLLRSTPQGKRSFPLLVTENFGRGRTVLLATEGTLALEDVDRSRRQDARDVLAADLPPHGDGHPGAGDGEHAQAGALRRDARADPRRGSRQAVQAGDERQGTGAVHGSGRRIARRWS